MLFFVSFEPVPASTTARPLAIFLVRAISACCSAGLRVGPSPVVPQGTRPATPPANCASRCFSNAMKSISEPSAENGVTSAVYAPERLSSAMARHFCRVIRPGATIRSGDQEYFKMNGGNG